MTALLESAGEEITKVCTLNLQIYVNTIKFSVSFLLVGYQPQYR